MKKWNFIDVSTLSSEQVEFLYSVVRPENRLRKRDELVGFVYNIYDNCLGETSIKYSSNMDKMFTNFDDFITSCPELAHQWKIHNTKLGELW